MSRVCVCAHPWDCSLLLGSRRLLHPWLSPGGSGSLQLCHTACGAWLLPYMSPKQPLGAMLSCWHPQWDLPSGAETFAFLPSGLIWVWVQCWGGRGLCQTPPLAPCCSAPPLAGRSVSAPVPAWQPASLQPPFFFQSRSVMSTIAMARMDSWEQVSRAVGVSAALDTSLSEDLVWVSATRTPHPSGEMSPRALFKTECLPSSRTRGLQGQCWGPRIHLHLPQRS